MPETEQPHTGKRFIQIYTGNGKGKSTAAYGLALRAIGAGLNVHLIQFMKEGFPYSELSAFKRLEDQLTVEKFCDDQFVLDKRPPTEAEIETAQAGLNRAAEIMKNGDADLLILDEICVACYFGLVKEEDLFPLFDARPDSIELVLTGRYCPQSWIDRADLVTKMTEVKHYLSQGITSRSGFDS